MNPRAPLSLRTANLISHLVAKRERLGWTRGDVAGLLKTSRQHIAQLEAGAWRPSLPVLIRWCDALGVMVRLIDVDAMPHKEFVRARRAEIGRRIAEGRRKGKAARVGHGNQIQAVFAGR